MCLLIQVDLLEQTLHGEFLVFGLAPGVGASVWWAGDNFNISHRRFILGDCIYCW